MTAIELVLKQFAMNTRLFKSALDGISEEDSVKQLTEHTNHLRWLAGHLTLIRYTFASRTGMQVEPYPHIEKVAIPNMPPPNARPLDKNIEYPSLAETLQYWDTYTEAFTKGISRLTEEQLAMENSFNTPINDKSMIATLGFVAAHEAYHIGQMSLIRKSLGYPSTKLM